MAAEDQLAELRSERLDGVEEDEEAPPSSDDERRSRNALENVRVEGALEPSLSRRVELGFREIDLELCGEGVFTPGDIEVLLRSKGLVPRSISMGVFFGGFKEIVPVPRA